MHLKILWIKIPSQHSPNIPKLGTCTEHCKFFLYVSIFCIFNVLPKVVNSFITSLTNKKTVKICLQHDKYSMKYKKKNRHNSLIISTIVCLVFFPLDTILNKNVGGRKIPKSHISWFFSISLIPNTVLDTKHKFWSLAVKLLAYFCCFQTLPTQSVYISTCKEKFDKEMWYNVVL